MKSRANICRVFVDFENVHTIDLALIDDEATVVTLLLGAKHRRLELGLVRQIQEKADRVILIEVGVSGRNALDLVLAWHLGKTAERWPEDAYFIVSKDQDFDPLIRHLSARGLKVERVADFAALPWLPASPPAPEKVELPPRSTKDKTAENQRGREPSNVLSPMSGNEEEDERLGKLTDRLQHKTKARPARKKTLLGHINGFYGKRLSETELEGVVQLLVGRGILTIDAAGGVTYPESAT